jgi:hypothetical protein
MAVTPPNDADIPTKHTTSTKNQGQALPSNINQGTLTRSREKVQQYVTSLLAQFDNNISKNVILPKSLMLVVLRFKHQWGDDPSWAGKRLHELCEKDGTWQVRTTGLDHPSLNSDYHIELTISPKFRGIYGIKNNIWKDNVWKDNQVYIPTRQMTCHLDFPIMSNDRFAANCQKLNGLCEVPWESISLWLLGYLSVSLTWLQGSAERSWQKLVKHLEQSISGPIVYFFIVHLFWSETDKN